VWVTPSMLTKIGSLFPYRGFHKLLWRSQFPASEIVFCWGQLVEENREIIPPSEIVFCFEGSNWLKKIIINQKIISSSSKLFLNNTSRLRGPSVYILFSSFLAISSLDLFLFWIISSRTTDLYAVTDSGHSKPTKDRTI